LGTNIIASSKEFQCLNWQQSGIFRIAWDRRKIVEQQPDRLDQQPFIPLIDREHYDTFKC